MHRYAYCHGLPLALVLIACGTRIGSSPPALDAGAGDAAPAADAARASHVCSGTSGTRLAVRRYRQPSGDFEIGMFDELLGEPCTFEKSQDGSLRCLPEGSPGAIYYRDDGCTDPVVAFLDSPLAFHRASVWDGDSCVPRKQVRKVLAAVPGDPGPLYTPTSGPDGPGCVGVTPSGGYSYYRVGPAYTSSSFVKGSLFYQESGTRILTGAVEGDDGSTHCDPNLLYDTELDADCSLRRDADGAMRCVPDGKLVSSLFLDDECTVEARYGISQSCDPEPPTFLYESVETECGTGLQTYRNAGEVQGVMHYFQSGGMCYQNTPGQRYYEPGPALGGGELEGFTSLRSGDGRLQRIEWLSEDGVGLFLGWWHDTDLGVSCRFQDVDGEAQRCMPEGPHLQSYYADAECETEIRVAMRRACEGAPSYLNDIEVGEWTTYAVGGQRSDPVYRMYAGACEVYDAGDQLLYEAGSPVPLSMFVEADEMIGAP